MTSRYKSQTPFDFGSAEDIEKQLEDEQGNLETEFRARNKEDHNRQLEKKKAVVKEQEKKAEASRKKVQEIEALERARQVKDARKTETLLEKSGKEEEALIGIDEEYSENNSNMASNNWVISGNHTKTGKPLLASDPHLSTGVPSYWTIQHLHYKEKIKGKI